LFVATRKRAADVCFQLRRKKPKRGEKSFFDWVVGSFFFAFFHHA